MQRDGYFIIHFADTAADEAAARTRQIRYYRSAHRCLSGDPKTAPPSYHYFVEMVERLRNLGPADLGDNSVLLGSPARIAESLKKVEAAGFDEVIPLMFNETVAARR